VSQTQGSRQRRLSILSPEAQRTRSDVTVALTIGCINRLNVITLPGAQLETSARMSAAGDRQGFDE